MGERFHTPDWTNINQRIGRKSIDTRARRPALRVRTDGDGNISVNLNSVLRKHRRPFYVSRKAAVILLLWASVISYYAYVLHGVVAALRDPMTPTIEMALPKVPNTAPRGPLIDWNGAHDGGGHE